MKKSKKLLSVLLAVLMLLSSMSVMASAAKAKYQTYDDLNGLNAYSKYGQVTRLDTETRLSMVFDMLDNVLEDADIHMDNIINVNLLITRLQLSIDLRSVTALCGTVDNVKSLLNNTLVRMVKWMLGIIADVNLSSWQTGMTRDSVNQMLIVTELCEVLRDNADLAANVLQTGNISLGVANSAIKNLDLSVIADIPGMLKGMVFPMFERKDDDQAQIAALLNTKGNGGLQTVLNSFVNGLFTKPQSTTTYKEDAEGNCISNHKLPTKEQNLRYYYEKSDGQIICYAYDTEVGDYVAEEPFVKTEEANGTYTYRKESGDALKYYEEGSYWLDSVTEAVNANPDLVDLTKNSAASLLYNFIPYVFAEMAPVVLNGSVKKLLAEALGATFTYVGDKGSKEVAALPNGSDTFFTQEQGKYVWEWTDYAVIGGTHYYRYEDKIFAGDISGANPFFALINWDYKITEDFVNDFVPGADGNTKSKAGYTTLLQGLNDFLVKAATTIMTPEFAAEVKLEKGDNSRLIANVKKAAQAVVAKSPETVFGAEYADADKYYSLVMSDDNQEVLIGIACTVIPMLMPQMILPTAETIKGKGYTIGAVLAAVLRELATQLVPNHNYDALIYEQYNNKTFVAGKNNEYWLDVILTIGTDIGISYLKAFADMGENTDAWTSGMPYKDVDTYSSEADMKTGSMTKWEARVDYIIDWALATDVLWAWHFDKLVDCGANIDLATPQDPWAKLGNILKNLLPVEDIFNVDFGNNQWLKTVLKDDFVLAIADLQPQRISDVLTIPVSSVLRQQNVFTQITTVLRDLINGLLNKVATVDLIPATVTDIDAVLNQSNIVTVVKTLLTYLVTAVNNGLLDPILPIANFFIGWTTDAQKYQDPTVSVTSSGNQDYLYASGGSASGTLSVRNDASGMIEKHRNSSVIDNAYIVTVTAIRSDDTTVTATSGLNSQVMPGGKIEIPFTAAYSEDKAVTIYVDYTLTGKDGKALGGTRTEVVQQYISNTAKPNLWQNDVEMKTSIVGTVNVTGAGYDRIQYITSAEDVSNFGITFSSGRNNAQWVQSASFPTAPASPLVAIDTSTFVHGNNENTSLANQGIGHLKANEASDYEPWTVHPVSVDPSYTVEPGDSYNAGAFRIAWRRSNNTQTGNFTLPTFYVLDIAELESVWKDTYSAMRDQYRKTSTVDALWNTFVAARNEATRLVLGPRPTDAAAFKELYNAANVAAKAKALRDAYDALARYYYVESSLSVLQDGLAKAEPEGETEINFQDYELYEYFNYADYRTDVRNRIKEYNGPEEPQKYFPDSSLYGNDAVGAMLSAVENPKKAAALKSTVIEPSDEEMAAYQQALDDFVEPQYTALDNEDMVAKLNYYKQFIIAKVTEKQFLNKELAYADAQGYKEDDYSKDSWAAYTDALETAQTVAANDKALQSEVFDAKYHLMKAENELLEASKSAKDTGALTDLAALVAKAEEIFADTENNNYKVKDGVNEDDAYLQLLEALGYKTEDGEILYDHSALTFIEYDRETTQNNLDRIAAAEAKLQAAIDNFESLAADPEIFPREEHHENEDVPYDGDQAHDGFVDTERGVNEELGLYGYLYGIEVGQDIYQVFHTSAVMKAIVNEKGVTNGTGATVEVYYADGVRLYKTYTVIIFGDVDGDAKINLLDANSVMAAALGNASLDGAYAFAADVDGQNGINLLDANSVMAGALGNATVTTNPYAD